MRPSVLYDRLIQAMAVAAGAMLVGVFAAIVYDVSVRTLGFQPPYWTSAMTEFALLFMTMLAAPWLVRRKGHVFVESVVRLLPAAARTLAAKTVYLLCILLGVMVCYLAGVMGWDMYQRGDFEMRSIDMPKWILFAALFVGFALSTIEFARYLVGVDDMYAGREPGEDGM